MRTETPPVRQLPIYPSVSPRPESAPAAVPSERAPEEQHSGILYRPIHRIRRNAVRPHTAVTELEKYKLSLRRYAPVQKGIRGLPWSGTWHCLRCESLVPGRFIYDAHDDAIDLEFECPRCGSYRERHHDVLFVRRMPPAHPRQPKRTWTGFPIRPILQGLPRTVETLCPECSCLILGRYYVKDNAVWMEKTCPEHGYFRDKINSDVRLYLKATRAGFEDERGVYEPQVRHAAFCPTDCGLCNQHHSCSALPQIDLTNRCNLTCPVCFASANQAGYVSEPTFEMVVEMMQALREQHPIPATTLQFTGGEPTLHPDFFRLLRKATQMGFTHLQIATNGLRFADPAFTQQAAEAGLHTLYMQFDGVDEECYRRLRAQPLLELKLRAIENVRQTDMKICLVPTIIRGVTDDQVGKILHFAAKNADVISGIAYQPVAFTGRISHQELEKKRYTLGDLAHDIAAASGADLERDFFPLNHLVPLARILETLDGKPKIRASCHSDCSFGTYFFVTPEHELIPIPSLFDTIKLFHGFNELAARIKRGRPDGLANTWDKLQLVMIFLRSYRWSRRDFRITPFTFMHTLRGMTNKKYGRGQRGKTTYRTLMAAGMHFMDRYNYDTERVRRCGILYSTVDGMYPFCTINGGPTYRPFIEAMYARPLERGPAWNQERIAGGTNPGTTP